MRIDLVWLSLRNLQAGNQDPNKNRPVIAPLALGIDNRFSFRTEAARHNMMWLGRIRIDVRTYRLAFVGKVFTNQSSRSRTPEAAKREGRCQSSRVLVWLMLMRSYKKKPIQFLYYRKRITIDRDVRYSHYRY